MAFSVGIRGAGAAGLSVARDVLRRVPEAKVSIFDRRARLPHPQRTFCFFDYGGLPRGVSPDHVWQRVKFSGRDFSRVVECPEAPYSLLRGERFFAEVLAEVESRGAVLRWECHSVEVSTGSLVVDGEAREFDLVVDAAFDTERQQPTLWQSFAGVWIELDGDFFDPTEALLMDLGASSADSPVSFVYVLPTSSRAALVEHTTFSRERQPKQEHLERCFEWIARRRLPKFSVKEIEEGAIPMGLPEFSAQHGRLSVGSSAGAIRASTGYAFQAIQAQAEWVAGVAEARFRAGSSHTLACPPAFPTWMRWADRLFLGTLARVPERGSLLMESLLRDAPEQELMAFLSGRASFSEALKVMWCVPKGPMLRTLCFG